MKRLLNLLLVLLLAIPAARGAAHPADAPSHAAHAAMPGGHGHHGTGHEAPAPGRTLHHECLGCIAPIDVGLYRPVSAAGAARKRAALPANVVAPAARTGSPEPPPPRFPA